MFQYDFDDELQYRIIAACVQDDQFLPNHRDSISIEYFSDSIARKAIYLVLKYFDLYSHSPDRVIFNTLYRNEYEDSTELEEVTNVLYGQMTGVNYVEDVVVKFARRAKLRNWVQGLPDKVAGDRWEDIQTEFTDISLIGNTKNSGLVYEKDYENRIMYIKDRTPRIPTLYRNLDRNMHGGLGSAELGVVIALTKRYKSTFMVNLTAAALLQNKNVYVATTELAAEYWASRLDIRLSGYTQDEMERVPDKAIKSLRNILDKYHSNILIKEFPSGSATWQMIRDNFELWRRRGYFFDLIVVDQIKNMRSARRNTERRFDYQDAAEGLRSMAIEYKIPMWAAHQATGDYKVKTLTVRHCSEAHMIAETADILLSLNQTDDEKERNKLRIFIAANRSGPSEKTIDAYVYPDHYRISDSML